MDRISENKNYIRERMVHGPIWSTVWWLAWPSVITMLLQTANGLVDALFVGRLGPDALSAVGLASQVMLVIMSISTAVSVGATALVARFTGAEEIENAEHATRQSILLGIFVGIASGALAYAAGPWLLKVMGGKGEALRLGLVYLNIILIANVPYFLMYIFSGIYRGLGDMRTPLIIMMVTTVIALLGDYLLIFGIGPFPRLGVAGAGMATDFSRIAAMLLFFIHLPKSQLRRVVQGSWRPVWSWFSRILNIGTPAGVQGLLRTGASVAYFAVLGLTPEGTYAIAALTIGLRMEALAFMPGFAFGTAATAMVGQNLGARQPDRAERAAWASTWQGIAAMGLVGICFVAFAHPISRLFTSDPGVLPLAAQYLMINGISEPFFALAMVLTGALQGAGETRLPTAATIVTNWIIRLPLTYYLAITLGMGAFGAWISMSGSTILLGFATLAVFKWSRWKEIRL